MAFKFSTKIIKLFFVACFSFQLKGDAEVQGYRKNTSKLLILKLQININRG